MKYVKLFENFSENVDELKQQIQEYLNQEFTEDWFENQFHNRVNDYIDDDLVGSGDPDDESTWDYKTAEEAYQNICTGDAVEYDLIEVMREDICKKFDMSNDDFFYKYNIDDIARQHIKDKAHWCDPFFGQSASSFFSKGVDDLMKRMDSYNDLTDDGSGIKL